ncbi:MAG: VOC family protein [Acidobacteriia bacterium]|nr:VOC family protein [Terriglobia bacterium]
MARPFSSGGANYVGVRDLATSVSWYKDKLGLREIDLEMDDSEGCTALGFSDDEYIVELGPPGKPTEELRPILFTKNIQKARDYVSSRGATLGPNERDAQGTTYFEIRDLEGNVIEICEEP